MDGGAHSIFIRISLRNFFLMEWFNEKFVISTHKGRLDIHFIHHYLSTQSYWSQYIPMDVVKKCIEGSICFGLYIDAEQIGFARVVTDCASFAYLCDVFIDEKYRGRGLSKWLLEVILSHPDLQGLRRFLLATRDAHGLYEQYGFSLLNSPERWMQIHNPDVYKKSG